MSAWEAEPAKPGANPWGANAFDPPTPKIPAPTPKARTPRTFPEKHDLYQVQKHALDVLHAIRDLEAALGDNPKAHKLIKKLERDAEDTYRVIRSYLANYVDKAV